MEAEGRDPVPPLKKSTAVLPPGCNPGYKIPRSPDAGCKPESGVGVENIHHCASPRM
jgi:hypothetical protein